MGRYVVLLIAPVIIGVLIAAGVALVNRLRRRRSDAREASLEARRPDHAPIPADPAVPKESSDLTRRRIA